MYNYKPTFKRIELKTVNGFQFLFDSFKEKKHMVEYCEICGEELDPDEEEFGICENCKKGKKVDEEYEKDEEFIDPGVT